MNAEEDWQALVAESGVNPIELETKTGLHFQIVSKGNALIVMNSVIEPSSKLKNPRPIYKGNFVKVFPYYERWANQEKGISKELIAITVNSVYIMAAIKYQEEKRSLVKS